MGSDGTVKVKASSLKLSSLERDYCPWLPYSLAARQVFTLCPWISCYGIEASMLGRQHLRQHLEQDGHSWACGHCSALLAGEAQMGTPVLCLEDSLSEA